MPVIPAMQEVAQEDDGPGWPGKNAQFYLKNNKSKKRQGTWLNW
jgi:hypothetical protein